MHFVMVESMCVGNIFPRLRSTNYIDILELAREEVREK